MKISISENKIEKLNQLIKDLGVKQAIQLMGGIKTFAIVLGHDNVPEYIYQYLTENSYPDYNWYSHDDYKQVVKDYGSTEFFVNDVEYYSFDDKGKLDIKTWLYDELDYLFDDYDWKSVFKKWFEDNTGLEVTIVE